MYHKEYNKICCNQDVKNEFLIRKIVTACVLYRYSIVWNMNGDLDVRRGRGKIDFLMK